MPSRKYIFILILTLLFPYPSPVYAKDNRGLVVTEIGQPHDVDWGNYHALIIGINAYQEWNPLQTAVKDAQELRDILIKRYGFANKNVILRTDQNATRYRIIRDLRNMATSMGENDNLLIYYAGHGQLDNITGDGYWVPVEGKLDDPSTWISQYIIKSILSSEKIRGKNIVVVADSCYSGTMLRGGPSLLPLDDLGYRQKLEEAAARRSRQVITSGGLEPVVDGGQDGHSLFAYYLLKALKENEHEVIDIENLFHTHVWRYVTEIGGQRPNIGRFKTAMDDDGQFVLIDKESSSIKIALKEQKKRERELLMQLMAAKERLEAEKKQLEAEKQLLEEKRRLESERLKMAREKQKLAKEVWEAEKQRLEAEKQLRATKIAYEEKLKQAQEQRNATKELKDVKVEGLEEKLKREKFQNKQLAYIPQTPAEMESDSRMTLAIFPFNRNASPVYIQDIINGLKKTLIGSELFFPKLSFYNLKPYFPKTKMIGKNILSSDVMENLWIKKNFFTNPEPNMELICKLGRELHVDLILICYFESMEFTQSFPEYIVVNLINVKTKKLNSVKKSFAIGQETNMHKESKILFKKVLHTVAKGESQQ